MRIGVRDPDGSGGWSIVRSAPELRIYLDEKLCRNVVAADDVRGEVWAAAHDELGNIVIDKEKNEIVLERRTGKVEIRRADEC